MRLPPSSALEGVFLILGPSQGRRREAVHVQKERLWTPASVSQAHEKAVKAPPPAATNPSAEFSAWSIRAHWRRFPPSVPHARTGSSRADPRTLRAPPHPWRPAGCSPPLPP